MVRVLLHMEGAAILIAALWALFEKMGLSWWFLPLLVLAPDLAMLGYLISPKVGAVLYNLGHTLAVALPVTFAGYASKEGWLLITGLILIGHIGMDRALGYGLKYPTGFKDSHLQRV